MPKKEIFKMYIPKPIDTGDVELSPEIIDLCEKLAENTHDVWAKGRIEQGWTYGPTRDDEKKETPCLVSYSALPEQEKDYDRNTSMETLKVIIKLGFEIKKPLNEVCNLSEGEKKTLNETDFNSEAFLDELDALLSDDSEIKEPDDAADETDNIVYLDDENGVSHRFEFLDLIEYEDNKYVILLPSEIYDDEDSGEVVILRAEESDIDNNEYYISIDDEMVLKAVFDIFKEKFQDEFDFSEYEEDD